MQMPLPEHIYSTADDYNKWTGQVRIAVLGTDGKPVASRYPDETVTRALNS